jgi:hypothetical protein
MLAEVANALFLTYIATEYIVASQDAAASKRFLEHQDDDDGNGNSRNARYRRWGIVTGMVVLINVLDRVLGVTMVLANVAVRETHHLVYALLHIPRIVVAAAFYLAALFWDCRRTLAQRQQQQRRKQQQQHVMTFAKDFLPRVLTAFLSVLPIYPLAAIFISCGFMILITIFEALHLPEDLLNWPIYYGTLYGPFSYIYHVVKLSIVKESQLGLPRTSSFGDISDPGHRLGGGSSSFLVD